MSQILRLDGFIKEFGINESRLFLLMKDAQVKCWENEGVRYTYYEDLLTMIQFRCLKHKKDELLAQDASSEKNVPLLTIKEACDFLRISRATLDRMRRDGTIETITAGGRPRFEKSMLLQAMKRKGL